ncbi:MAG: hypothetical protein HC915_05200 [Anaerolineae bacterium]|nr:hypothetical protein [Anaerolineae bacterium]
MTESPLSLWTSKLKDAAPEIRAQACKELGRLRDPAAIRPLVNAYQQDSEASVRLAAEAALRKLGRQAPGAGGEGWLRVATLALVGSLVILLGLNVALRLGGGDAEEVAAPTATPETPTDRDVLLSQYQNLLQQAQADVAAMRAEWNLGAGQLTCAATLNRPQPIEMRPIDDQTYPDFGFVPTLNQAVTNLNFFPIRFWDVACADGTRGTVQQAIDASDELTRIETFLAQAEQGLTQAIENPLMPIDVSAPEAPTPESTPAELPTPEAPATEPTPTPEGG